MPNKKERAVRLLLKALGSLPDEERDEVLQHLLLEQTEIPPLSLGPMEAGVWRSDPATLRGRQFDPVSRMLPVRLPAELQERLRTWSTEHGFSMAAVARGLIERFLDEQERSAK
jgi:hypothetical protein